MKVPKTFIPDKDLEGKTGSLLEERIKSKGDYFINEKAEKLFPNFINFLKGEYGALIIEELPNQIRKTWNISVPRNDGRLIQIGSINCYVKEKGQTSEYGYEADIVIQEIYKKLLYRTSYQGYDSLGSIVFEEDPLRYDSENIPFP